MKELKSLLSVLGSVPLKVYPFVTLIFVLVYYKGSIDKWLNKKIDQPKINIEQTSSQQLVVYDAMEELMRLTDADRVYILQFHNGTYLFEEGHQLKFSMTFERRNLNIEPLFDDFQAIPTSIYTYYFNSVWNDKARWPDIDAITDFTARSGFKKINTKAHIGIPCYRDGKPFAVVCLGWVNRQPDPELILYNFKMDKWDSDSLYYTVKGYAQDISDRIPINP